MTLTLAQLLGTPVHANEFDLDGALEQGKKATGGGSAVAAGRIVFHTNATGTWAIGTSGSTGRMGIIPNLAPLNLDADTALIIGTRVGGQYFVEANGAIKPGAQCTVDTGGKLKTTTGGQGPFIYKGHDGEGTLGNPMTDAAAGEAVKTEITGQVA